MHCVYPEVTLSLLCAAVRQWGAFLETQIAIEKTIGVAGTPEIRDYIFRLAPEFIDHPEELTTQHVESLTTLFEQAEAAAEPALR